VVFTPGSRFERTRNEREFLSFNRSPPAAIETADDRATSFAVEPVVGSVRDGKLPFTRPTADADLAPFPAFARSQIVCVNTAACLFAGRFGLAPTVNKNYGGADSYGKMVEAERPRVQSRDPAGFTIVDVAAWGSLAHIISAGEILGQKAAGFF
jgi:photosystem I subunit 10